MIYLLATIAFAAIGLSVRITRAFLEQVNDSIFINSSEEVSLRERLLRHASKIGFSVVGIDNMAIENIDKMENRITSAVKGRCFCRKVPKNVNAK